MDKYDGGDPVAMRVDDPWQNLAAGLWMPEQTVPMDVTDMPEEPHILEVPKATEVPVSPRVREAAVAANRAALYLEVQHSADFREVRERYRRFAFPAVAAFVCWYLLYVVAATTAPRLMAHRVAGELNVAMIAGLAQFATTFLLTWAYTRHARLRRDRAALDLRWTLATRTGQERVR